MILNFEAELAGETYDCDADVCYRAGYTGDGEILADPVVRLIEVRLVGEDERFVVVDQTVLAPGLVEELKKRALAEYDWQAETAAERRLEGDR